MSDKLALAYAPPERARPGLRLAPLLIVVVPMVLLLSPGQRPAEADWGNGVWTVGYTSAYLRAHGSLPVAFITDKVVGQPLPVFYAPLLYPMLALPALVLGAENALRAACVLVWAMQFALVSRLVSLAAGNRVTGMVAGALACWAVYPLTNLYSRGAIPEFFGGTFLLCAACAGGLALLGRRRLARVATAALCGWCGAAAAGAHGVTAMVGGPVLACLALAALGIRPAAGPGEGPDVAAGTSRPRLSTRALGMAGVAAAVAVTLLPWLYVVRQFHCRLAVQSRPLRYFENADAWNLRLAPIPIYDDMPGGVAAPVNVPLALLFAGAIVRLAWVRPGRSAWRRHGPLLAVSLTLFAVTLLLSILPAWGRALPPAIGGTLQFAYRLVTYQNLTLLTGLVATLLLLGHAGFVSTNPADVASRFGPIGAVPIVLSAALGIAALGVKLHQAYATFLPVPEIAGAAGDDDAGRGDAHLLSMPRFYYGWADYSVADRSREVSADASSVPLQLSPRAGSAFGDVAGETRVESPGDRLIVTNVLAFPWNRLVLDGQLVPEQQTRTTPEYLAVHVPTGTHAVGHHLAVDPAWARLRTVSLALFAAWTFAAAGLIVGAILTRRGGEAGGSAGTALNAARAAG